MQDGLDPGLLEKLRSAKGAVYLNAQKVGAGQPTYFIAEIGNNHNGDFFLAKKSIEAAAKAGAHAVKLQKRSIRDVFAKELRDKPQTKGDIQGETYGEYREGLELSLEEFIKLKEIAAFNNVAFFATPFDIPSVDFLERVGVPFYKLASFDVTNLPLLEYVAQKGKPVILSTGMATLEEVDEAVMTILQHNPHLIILHCVSVYPSPDEEIRLGVMQALQERYHPIPVGYSGHERDTLPSLIAVARGATIVERHFTLSTHLPGPDHESVSLDPEAFASMTRDAKRIHVSTGSREKDVFEHEKATREKHSKSITTRYAIKKGEVFRADMLTCKSPGYGLKPRDFTQVIGKRAASDLPEDAVLRREDVEWETSIPSPIQVTGDSKN